MQSNQSIVREGFRVLKASYSPPRDSVQLAAELKRKITICNLFLNHGLSINDIAKTLDETYKHAVGILIEQEIIEERRSVSREKQQRKQLSLFGSRLKNAEKVK